MEWIIRVLLRSVKCIALILVELAGEIVTIHNSEDSAIDIEIGSKVQVSPRVVQGGVLWPGDLVAFQKYSLRNATVFNSALNDVNCVVVEVVVNDALSDSVVLVGVLNNWLLEVTIELEDLFMKNKLAEYNKLNRYHVPVCRT